MFIPRGSSVTLTRHGILIIKSQMYVLMVLSSAISFIIVYTVEMSVQIMPVFSYYTMIIL